MKKTLLIAVFALIGISAFAQSNTDKQSERITKYVTTFPNGDEAITITDNSTSTNLMLSSADNFYKYEILETSNHELIHGESNTGKVCDIDKTNLDEGTYTLKVYTDDFVITSDITIGETDDATGA